MKASIKGPIEHRHQARTHTNDKLSFQCIANSLFGHVLYDSSLIKRSINHSPSLPSVRSELYGLMNLKDHLQQNNVYQTIDIFLMQLLRTFGKLECDHPYYSHTIHMSTYVNYKYDVCAPFRSVFVYREYNISPIIFRDVAPHAVPMV